MNTLAVRDQENFVHNQQTAAAAKPLNQGVRGLAPKTPGNNGFKNIVNAHKTIRGQKGDENVAPAAKTAKALKTSFVTPTGVYYWSTCSSQKLINAQHSATVRH